MKHLRYLNIQFSPKLCFCELRPNKIEYRRDTLPYACSRVLSMANDDIFAGSVIESRVYLASVAATRPLLRKGEGASLMPTHCCILSCMNFFLPIADNYFHMHRLLRELTRFTWYFNVKRRHVIYARAHTTRASFVII